jgi:hypothetical protein
LESDKLRVDKYHLDLQMKEDAVPIKVAGLRAERAFKIKTGSFVSWGQYFFSPGFLSVFAPELSFAIFAVGRPRRSQVVVINDRVMQCNFTEWVS